MTPLFHCRQRAMNALQHPRAEVRKRAVRIRGYLHPCPAQSQSGVKPPLQRLAPRSRGASARRTMAKSEEGWSHLEGELELIVILILILLCKRSAQRDRGGLRLKIRLGLRSENAAATQHRDPCFAVRAKNPLTHPASHLSSRPLLSRVAEGSGPATPRQPLRFNPEDQVPNPALGLLAWGQM